MQPRTDLAIETRELTAKNTEGVTEQTETAGNIKISRIKISSEHGAAALCKPIGTYITLENINLCGYVDVENTANVIAAELARVIPKSGSALFAGLGNRGITPDAIGPAIADGVFATRHIKKETAKKYGLFPLRSVAVTAPGVLGQTGMETLEAVSADIAAAKPDFVIIADALASRRLERLGSTIQICDSGISPGSGVGNSRPSLCKDTLGVPVIALGVPTVADIATLCSDFAADAGASAELCEKLNKNVHSAVIVTPRDIDILLRLAADVLSLAVNRALNPHLSADDFKLLLG